MTIALFDRAAILKIDSIRGLGGVLGTAWPGTREGGGL